MPMSSPGATDSALLRFATSGFYSLRIHVFYMDMNFSDQEPLVILPGLMCDSRMFLGQIAAFPEALVIDGFYGNATRLPDMADYALERIPHRCNLVGHSMGARVALEIMRKAPDRVGRLALVNTGVHAVRDGEAEKRYALRDLGRSEGFRSLVDSWLPPMLTAAARSNRELVERLEYMCFAAGQATFERHIEAILARSPTDDVLEAIDCPTHVIVGTEDLWAPPSQHAEFAARIKNAQLREIVGAGHMLPAEKPEEFNNVLREWLGEPAPRSNDNSHGEPQ